METEDDYFRAMRKYKKEIKKKVLAEVEKEVKKIKRQKKADTAKETKKYLRERKIKEGKRKIEEKMQKTC